MRECGRSPLDTWHNAMICVFMMLVVVLLLVSLPSVASDGSATDPVVNGEGYVFDFTDTDSYRFRVVTPDPDDGGAQMGAVRMVQKYDYEGEVTIPGIVSFVHDGVTYTYRMVDIDQGVMYQWEITSLYLPSTLETFREGYLDGCSALEEVNVDPASTLLKSIDGVVFTRLDNGGLELTYFPCYRGGDYTVPSWQGVKIIGSCAFETCTRLVSVTVSEGVLYIGPMAFSLCENLQVVRIPASVNSIDFQAFNSNLNLNELVIDSNNQNYVFENGLLMDISRTTLLQYIHPGYMEESVIPDTVTTITKRAYYWCMDLERVVIPDSVERIEDEAFNSCTGLKEVVMGKGVMYLGESVFCYCRALESIVFPDGLTRIPFNTFYDCSKLRSVTLPMGLQHIDRYAFAYTSLTEIELPRTLRTIGDRAFETCRDLHTLTTAYLFDHPDGDPFHNCTGLNVIKLTSQEGSIHFDGKLFSACSPDLRFESGIEGYSLKVSAPGVEGELTGKDLMAYRGDLRLEWTAVDEGSGSMLWVVIVVGIVLVAVAIMFATRRARH